MDAMEGLKKNPSCLQRQVMTLKVGYEPWLGVLLFKGILWYTDIVQQHSQKAYCGASCTTQWLW